MRGVLDRIEDGQQAVIILESGGEIILPLSHLPEGSSVNSWFMIEEEGGEMKISLDEELRRKREQQASTIQQELRTKRAGSRFKKK